MDNTALLIAIIQNAIDGIITIDENGIIELINPAACTLFDYESEDVIGKNISMLMPQPDKDSPDNYMFLHQQTGRKNILGIGREVTGLRKNGVSFLLDWD